MNYEEKYERALKVASQWHKDGIGDVKTIVECIFPELRESEDERIRKGLIKGFQHYDKECKWGEFTTTEILSWLEKQGGQGIIDLKEYAKGILKGAAIHLMLWIDENLADGKMCLSNMECKDLEDAMVNAKWDKIYNYIKKKVEKQGEQPSWSEEDEKMLDSIIDCLDGLCFIDSDQLNWLKSLKSKKHWKPSEEQMEALKKRTHGLHTSSETRKALESLINDLEKL